MNSSNRIRVWTAVLAACWLSAATTRAIAQDKRPTSGEAGASEKTNAPGDAEPAEAESDEGVEGVSGWRVYWTDALRVESPRSDLKLKFGGRIQLDGAVFDARNGIEELGDFDDDFEVRRARVYYSGTWRERFEFKTQIELSENNVEARDVYIGLRGIPIIGNIRLGHFKEPIGLNVLTSSKYLMFMERSLTADAFQEDRNAGVMIHDSPFKDRMTWALGVFRDTDQYFSGEINDGIAFTGRVTGLPWYEDDGAKLLHLGFAWRHFDPRGDPIRVRSRPEAHLAPRLIDTGNIQADMMDILGLEFALIHGPFSVQGEVFQALINRKNGGGELQFNTFYVEASYFLTGEHRNYLTTHAAFGKIKPKKDFGKDGGWGAWEVAARYSYLDLNDDDISGGRLNNFSAGVNWYLNQYTRVIWNYVYVDPDDSGQVHAFQMRLQISF